MTSCLSGYMYSKAELGDIYANWLSQFSTARVSKALAS
jgi:hypothetical protein